MTRDAATRAGRLLARARRPALDPWALATVHDVDVESAPRFVASASPAELLAGLERPAGRATLPPEPHAGESATKAAAATTAVAPPAPPVRSSRLRAVEPDPASARQRARNPLPDTFRPAPRAATGADPSRHVEGAPQSGEIAAAPASLRPAPRAPGAPDTARAHALDPASRPATANRLPEAPAPADGEPPAATVSHPARHQPPLPLTAAVAAGEPAAPVRAASRPASRPAVPPSRQSTRSAPPVVIDEIRIVTPPAAGRPRDPLASLAAQRVGASRHRGGERWRA
jgi:hypothetical protein